MFKEAGQYCFHCGITSRVGTIGKSSGKNIAEGVCAAHAHHFLDMGAAHGGAGT